MNEININVRVHVLAPNRTVYFLQINMKGYWGHLVKNHSGTIKLTPEDTDDIWNLYNIISVGDEIESVTIR